MVLLKQLFLHNPIEFATLFVGRTALYANGTCFLQAFNSKLKSGTEKIRI